MLDQGVWSTYNLLFLSSCILIGLYRTSMAYTIISVRISITKILLIEVCVPMNIQFL